ncbi:MAG: SDR family NAD(P)-dependent oxidoreductase [Bryobacteraceae bacterium]
MALVVGASSGIGLETAILLARDGVRVTASARMYSHPVYIAEAFIDPEPGAADARR